MADTRPLNGSNTVAMSPAALEDRIFLFDDIVFEGKNGTYRILASEFIGCGGESVVYKATRLSDGKEFVAKIYDQFQDTKLNRTNRQKAIDFVLSHSNYCETHILPLIDYGRINVESEDGEDYRMPIDILPICSTEELKKVDYKTLKERVIPQVLHAINLMHKANIVHRDIKPGNIYTLNGQIVVADFGTACEINDSTVKFYNTTQKRGTLGYTAPEVWQGYAVTGSDYFSFGCTIATLYHGEHVYQRLVDMNDEGAINKAINSNGLPLGCKETDEDLQTLVDALATVDETKRAKFDDVKLWLEDPKTFERKNKVEYTASSQETFTFHFENIICRSEKELISALTENWEVAKNYLYRGGVKNSTLVNFFSKFNQALAIKIGEIIEAKETATNYDLGLAQVIHIISDGGSLVWRGSKYGKLSDISNAIQQKETSVENISSMLASGYLSWKLERSKDPDKNTIVAVKEIESIARKYPKIAFYFAGFRFAPKPLEQKYHGLKTVDEIFDTITRNSTDFYQKIDATFVDDELFAFIAHLGYKDNVLSFREKITGNGVSNLEFFYRLFETTMTNKTKIREHYIKFGPCSYLYWLQEHLSLYEFKGFQAQRCRDNIKNVSLKSSMTIDDLSRSFAKLREYQKDFESLFQGNIMLTYLGLTDSSKSITSNNSDAYFIEDFLGQHVPAGYARYIKSK